MFRYGAAMATSNNIDDITVLQKSFRFCVIASCFVIFAILLLTRVDSKNVTDFLPIFYFQRQDIWLAAIILFTWLKLASTADSKLLGLNSLLRFGELRYAPGFIIFALFAICYAGHYLLLSGYDVSRDEQMGVFDAIIFADGRLAWPIAEHWRGMAPALNQIFILPIGAQEAWVSAYLPVNSAVRALFSCIGDQSFASPFFVGIGAIALWKITRIVWPERKDISSLCLILYAGSGQILITGMTAYAMSGHLGLNLIWLWLFLLNRRRADFAALVIGFLATGMHQPLFHPMFAAPILAILVIQRQWPRSAIYLFGYAMICAFWLYWPIAISNLAAMPPANAEVGIDYLTRLTDAVGGIGLGGLMLMLANIFRFAVWQHLLLIPLAAAGIYSVWRAKNGFGMALAVSFILPIPVMLILLPYQGHGWGYRYLHPVLGNAIILAGFGWRTVEPKQVRQKLLLVTTAMTFVLMIPMQFYFAHSFYAPWASVDRAISKSKADIALIDTTAAPFAVDIVLNRPDLFNRPVRLAAAALTPGDYADLCRSHAEVVVVGAKDFAPVVDFFGVASGSEANIMAQAIADAQHAGCVVMNGR